MLSSVLAGLEVDLVLCLREGAHLYGHVMGEEGVLGGKGGL